MGLLNFFNKVQGGNIFAKGRVLNSPQFIFMDRETSGQLLKWVAVKGYADDWTIYFGTEDQSWEMIQRLGDKYGDIEKLKYLLFLDGEEWEEFKTKYRR